MNVIHIDLCWQGCPSEKPKHPRAIKRKPNVGERKTGREQHTHLETKGKKERKQTQLETEIKSQDIKGQRNRQDHKHTHTHRDTSHQNLMRKTLIKYRRIKENI